MKFRRLSSVSTACPKDIFFERLSHSDPQPVLCVVGRPVENGEFHSGLDEGESQGSPDKAYFMRHSCTLLHAAIDILIYSELRAFDLCFAGARMAKARDYDAQPCLASEELHTSRSLRTELGRVEQALTRAVFWRSALDTAPQKSQ